MKELKKSSIKKINWSMKRRIRQKKKNTPQEVLYIPIQNYVYPWMDGLKRAYANITNYVI